MVTEETMKMSKQQMLVIQQQQQQNSMAYQPTQSLLYSTKTMPVKTRMHTAMNVRPMQ